MKITPLRIAAAATLMTIAHAICAQDPISANIATILDNNAELKSQRSMIVADRAEAADANALANPEVEFARVWGRHGIGNKLQLDVSQEFDWPGLYRLRNMAANQSLSAAEMMVVSAELDMALQAKEQMLQLVYVRQHIGLNQELRGNIDRLSIALDNALDRGLVTILDLRKLQVEAYKLDGELASLRSEERQLLTELQALCPAAPLQLDDVTAYPIEPLLSAQEYKSMAATLDPLLAAHRLTAESEGTNARVASQSRMPGFSVGYQHQAEMGDRFNGFTVAMSLPFFQNRHARAAALSRQQAAELSADALSAEQEAQVESLIAEMENWRAQVEAYKRVFGDNSYLTLLQRAYEGGEMTVIEYLNEVQYYHDATFAYLEALHNYAQAMARLNRYSLLR